MRSIFLVEQAAFDLVNHINEFSDPFGNTLLPWRLM
jgi:hypothetical protein